jgi:hypothetical protein
MIVRIIPRIIATLFLVFHGVVFIGVAIHSFGGIISQAANADKVMSIAYLLLAFLLAVWVWGILQKVFRRDWPKQIMPHIQLNRMQYLATLLIAGALYLLIDTSVGNYAGLAYRLGMEFGLIAQSELLQRFSVSFPLGLTVFIAWVFHWYFSALMVGFIEMAHKAYLRARKGSKDSPQE